MRLPGISFRWTSGCLASLFLAVSAAVAGAQTRNLSESGAIDPWVEREVSSGNAAEFLVVLKAQADLSGAESLATKEEKGAFVYSSLKSVAEETQPALLSFLRERGLPHRPFLIVNAIWVLGRHSDVKFLASRPEVARLVGNPRTRGLVAASRRFGASEGALRAIEAGISYCNAPQVWSLGYTGQGIVVGGQDTGYQWDHPALIAQYRGWNGTTASHDYNWHDSIHSGGGGCGADSPVPCDDNSHGTHTMGTAVGDDGAGNQIGMAPGARWIGSRNMDQGNGTPTTYLESFEFFLAPYPVNGTPSQGNPAMAPDLTTNSWLCPPSEGCTAPQILQLAVQAQRAAGIMTLVAAGNSGSGCSTVDWAPTIYAEVTSVGALVANSDSIAGFSSRGPVTVDGSNRLKPDICAPGTGVRSCVPGNGYAGGWAGTSMATPHVAGGVALLWSAHPALRGNVTVTEQVLYDTAVHLNSSSCSSNGSWPNNVFGHGRMDVLAAVHAVRGVAIAPPSGPLLAQVGTTAAHSISVTNQGYLPDSFAIAIPGSTWSASPASAVVGPIAAGATVNVIINVAVPANAIGQSGSTMVDISSVAFPSELATVTLTTQGTPVVPVIALSLSGGSGSPTSVQNSNLVPGHEYWNIFSGELCPGVAGSGPYLGLCASDPQSLLNQFLVPVGTIPFHFFATQSTATFGPYSLPPGLTLEAVCFDLTGGQLLGVSQVVRVTL